MNCSICGAQIPAGQSTCPTCGAAVQQSAQPMGGYQQPVQPMGGYQQPVQPMGGYQQPVQPMGGYQQPVQPMGGYQQPAQPMGGYQQPAQPMGGYQQSMPQPQQAKTSQKAVNLNMANLAGEVDDGMMKIIGMIGAILIMLNPLLSWCSCKMELWGYEEKKSINMFGIAKGDEGIKIFAFIAVMMILAGAFLILWDIAEMFPPVAQIKQKLQGIPFLELIVIGVVPLLFIIAMANGDVNEVIKEVDSLGGNCNGSHGIGPVFCFLGMLAAAAPRVFKLLGIKLG